MMQSSESSGHFRWFESLIAKPLVAALFAGLGINLLLAVNEQLLYGTNYLTEITFGLTASFLSSLSKLFIPFIIPYLFIHFNNNRVFRSLLKFPEANPDIIFKLDDEGSVIYANQTAKAYLERLPLPEGKIEGMLPDHYRDIMAQLSHQPGAGYGSKAIDGVEIDYTFRTFPGEKGVFVSGRDITQKKQSEHALSSAYRDMVGITGFLDKTLDRFDPVTFEIDEHFKAIMGKILTDENCHQGCKATHVFLATKEGERLTGNIYSLWRGNVYKDPDEIVIDTSSDRAAIACCEGELVWSNWEKEGKSIEAYQEKFHPLVKEKVGIVERFATYTSGDIAVIAFFSGRLVDRFDAYLLKGITVYANSLKRISDEIKETEKAFIYTVEALARAAEGNDQETGDHIARVNEYSKLLADGLGMASDFVRTISYSAQMHDVGKIFLPRHILKKGESLSKEEQREMNRHPAYGVRILGDSPRLKMAAEIALTHHEKFSGKGYPAGLKREEIPMSGRIVKLVDVYDALRQKRSYKPGYSHKKAMEIITQGDGRVSPSDFDPKVLAVFVRLNDRMDEIFLQSRRLTGSENDRKERSNIHPENVYERPLKVA